MIHLQLLGAEFKKKISLFEILRLLCGLSLISTLLFRAVVRRTNVHRAVKSYQFLILAPAILCPSVCIRWDNPSVSLKCRDWEIGYSREHSYQLNWALLTAAVNALFRKSSQRERDVEGSACHLRGFAYSAQVWVIFDAPKTASLCLNGHRNRPKDALLPLLQKVIRLMRNGWGTWGCSAWREGCSGGTLLLSTTTWKEAAAWWNSVSSLVLQVRDKRKWPQFAPGEV